MADHNSNLSGRNWVKIGGWLSGGYLAALAVSAWPLTHFGMLTLSEAFSLNELGDALAGIFAPLAFLWLFVATMVQSQELALQRNELELSRNVSSEQAAEAKRTAEYIGAQTDLLKQEAERRRQETGDLELDAKIATFTTTASQMARGCLEAVIINGPNIECSLKSIRSHRDLLEWTETLDRWLISVELMVEQGRMARVLGLADWQCELWDQRVAEIYASKPITPEAQRYLKEACLDAVMVRLVKLPLHSQ